MADYKAMYYHLAGRMAVAVDVMDATVVSLEASAAALRTLTEKFKLAQQATEDMFINCDEDNPENT